METEKINLIEVGKRVKEAREAKKLSQAALAGMMFLSQNAIAKIEKGKTAKINLDHIHQIAEICGVLEDYLLLRCDYRTMDELYKAMSDRSEKVNMMWQVFLSRIATNIGYDCSILQGYQEGFENSNTLFVFKDGEGKEFYFDWFDSIYPLLDDITAHSGLALKRMIARAAIKESVEKMKKEGDDSNGKDEREKEQEVKR